MDKVVAFSFAAVFVACALLANAGTLYFSYNWLAVPAFDLHAISFKQSFVASFIIGVIFRASDTKEVTDTSKPFVRFCMVLISSWIISFFM